MSIWSAIAGKRAGERLELVLFTRSTCPLCDVMKAEIARSAPARRCSLREVDIDGDPELVERYGRSVPVLEIAGRAAFKGRLTVAELDEKIARALRERELA